MSKFLSDIALLSAGSFLTASANDPDIGEPADPDPPAIPNAPVFTSPAKQAVFTVGVPNTITATGSAPPEFFADGISLGTGTLGDPNTYSLSWTPSLTDYDVDITGKIGATVSNPVNIAVAEANHISNPSLWTRTNVTSVTGGQSDPDGGTGAYRVLSAASATAVAHYINRAASPANTTLDPCFEVWAKADTASKILCYWIEDGAKHYCYVDLANGQTMGQWCTGKIVETRGDWKRILIKSQGGAATQSTMRIYIVNSFTTNHIMAGTEAIYIYNPRVIDGSVRFSKYQMATPRYVGVVNNLQRWAVRTPYVDTLANMTTDRFIDVLVPDNYNPNNQYPVLYVGEVEATPNVLADGLQTFRTLNVHNDYNCIIARCLFAGIAPWYGSHYDGTKQYDVQIKDVLVGLVDEFYSTIPNRENRLYIGFSKSGFGAFSSILRNPSVFGYAAAWDVPWNISYGTYETGVNFGSVAQFNLYNPIGLLQSKAASVNDKKRLVISGAYTFAAHVQPMMDAMDAAGITYTYRNQSASNHDWNTGWLPNVVADLFALKT